MFHYVSISFLAKFIGLKQKVLLNFQTLLSRQCMHEYDQKVFFECVNAEKSGRPASKFVCMAFLNVYVFSLVMLA